VGSQKQINFETVRQIALALPGVEDGTAYGAPALRVGGKLLACLPVNPSAEPNSLVVCVAIAERDELIAADPDVYYVTDHYVPYNDVLVRLARIDRHALRGLLQMAVQFVGRKPTARASTRKRTRPRQA
jgi:hypothetical protein